ncbi:SMR family transporter [Amycolatopsis sp. OK19-0408]|uniref:SMR family transporter n=1 Tax=Amycolatopsis iheyensis TaxID=2945988 RepID=A0A9X2NGQ9_9PSEU|nr:SMR family transporter [Amycolatopsis iheyensis]MCR6487483.1 SMR family transporter [Amycolatopsis iheyensis]
MTIVVLALAIASGLSGTLFTRASHGFTRWASALAAVVSFAMATLLLSWLVQRLPVGLVYAVWTGTAAVVLVIVDRIFFAVRTTPVQLAGMAVTLAGVTILGIAG